MTKIISNATPLIAFAKIEQLPLMQKIVGNLIIPEAVAAEISAYTSTAPGTIILADEPWIQIKPLQSDVKRQLLLPSLDRGEAAVIALALERQASLVFFRLVKLNKSLLLSKLWFCFFICHLCKREKSALNQEKSLQKLAASLLQSVNKFV